MAEQSEASEKKQLELLAERLERLAAEEHSFRLRRAAARGLSPADARRSASASPAKLANRMEKLEQDAQRARRRNDDVGDFCCEWMVWVQSCGWRRGSERVASSRRQFLEAVEDLLPSWGEVAERKAVQAVSKAKVQLQALKARREEALRHLERSRRLGDEMRQIQAELQEHQEELPGLYQALAKDVISPGLLATRSTLEDVALLTPGSQGISQVATTAGGAQSTGPPSGSHPVAWPGPWYPFVPWSWVAAQSGPTPPGCPATPTPTPQVQVPAAPCQGQQTATAHPEPARSPQVVEQPQVIHPTQAQRPPSERAVAETAPAPRSSPAPAGQSALAQPAIGSPSANNLAEADAKLQVAIAQEVPAEKASARERREASSPEPQAPAPAAVMVPAIATVSTASPAAASAAAPQPKAANQGPDVVCQGPEASSPQQVLKQVKLLLAGAASGSPPGPSALRAALRSAKTEPWYAETVAQLDGMADSATAELQGMSTTQRVAVALLLLKVHMSSSGAAQEAAKLAAAGPTELGPGGDFAWQELLSLLPPWRRAMTKADFEAFCRISAEHLLPRFKAERVRRLSQVLIELYPPASALEDPQAKASPPSAAQRHPASTSSPLDATSSYRRRQLGAVAAVQRMGDREKDAANVKGAGRGSGSIDLSSLIRRDPAWRVAAKTTDSDSDEIADVNDL